jgi:hypothetical protein
MQAVPRFEPINRHERLLTSSFIQKMPGSIPNVAINIKIKYNKKTRPGSNNQLPMDEMRAM